MKYVYYILFFAIVFGCNSKNEAIKYIHKDNMHKAINLKNNCNTVVDLSKQGTEIESIYTTCMDKKNSFDIFSSNFRSIIDKFELYDKLKNSKIIKLNFFNSTFSIPFPKFIKAGAILKKSSHTTKYIDKLIVYQSKINNIYKQKIESISYKKCHFRMNLDYWKLDKELHDIHYKSINGNIIREFTKESSFEYKEYIVIPYIPIDIECD